MNKTQQVIEDLIALEKQVAQLRAEFVNQMFVIGAKLHDSQTQLINIILEENMHE
jgi:hypothetical protein